MKLLDLFCGAGGASVGYASVGFEVVGVDVVEQPDYPYPFHLADAMTFPLDGFDVVHASPPCLGETEVRSRWQDLRYERLLVPTLERFRDELGSTPWIVENVDGAEAPIEFPRYRLCGSSFGLPFRRHRWFWSNVGLLVPACDHRSQRGSLVGIYGHGDGPNGHRSRARGPRQVSTAEARELLGMPWVSKRKGLTNAVPPIFAAFLGQQLALAVSS